MTCVLSSGSNCAGEEGSAVAAITREAIVYYANETRPEILRSANYRTIFSALEKSGLSDAGAIISQISRDAEKFAKEVEQDIDELLKGARRHHLSAVFFTNRLARQGLFQVLDGRSGVLTTEPLPALAGETTSILQYSPLSRPDSFLVAMETVGKLPQTLGRDLILITSSHGDEQMALMPRVIADLSAVSEETYIEYLKRPPSSYNSLPEYLRYKGVRKIEFWRILSRSGLGPRLKLVIRGACQGGVLTLSEYRLIPAGIGAIGHTGRGPWHYDQIDYRRLLSELSPEGSLSDQVWHGVREQGIQVETPREIGLRLVKVHLVAWSPLALFLPLIFWCGWAIRRLRKSPSSG